PDVRERSPEVPEGLANAVRLALHRDLDARCPTADAFRRALVDVRATGAIRAVDDAHLAEWIAEAAPPAASPGQLERELLEWRATVIADRPTVPPAPDVSSGPDVPTAETVSSSAARAPLPRENTGRRAIAAVLVAGVAAGVVAYATRERWAAT